MQAPTVSAEDAQRTGDALSVNWNAIPLETFQEAMNDEMEHSDVTHGDLMVTGRIALAHFREDPDFYTRLARAENEAKEYWSTRVKPSPTILGGGVRTYVRIVAATIVVIALIALVYFAIKGFPAMGLGVMPFQGFQNQMCSMGTTSTPYPHLNPSLPPLGSRDTYRQSPFPHANPWLPPLGSEDTYPGH